MDWVYDLNDFHMWMPLNILCPKNHTNIRKIGLKCMGHKNLSIHTIGNNTSLKVIVFPTHAHMVYLFPCNMVNSTLLRMGY